MVFSLLTGDEPLLELVCSMLLEDLHDDAGHVERPAAGPRLWRDADEPLALLALNLSSDGELGVFNIDVVPPTGTSAGCEIMRTAAPV